MLVIRMSFGNHLKQNCFNKQPGYTQSTAILTIWTNDIKTLVCFICRGYCYIFLVLSLTQKSGRTNLPLKLLNCKLCGQRVVSYTKLSRNSEFIIHNSEFNQMPPPTEPSQVSTVVAFISSSSNQRVVTAFVSVKKRNASLPRQWRLPKKESL